MEADIISEAKPISLARQLGCEISRQPRDNPRAPDVASERLEDAGQYLGVFYSAR